MRLIIILISSIFCLAISLAQDTGSLAPTIGVDNPVIVNSENFTLAWDQSDPYDIYQFELCTDAQCDQKINELQKAGRPEIELTGIQDGQYFWRVCIVDENGELGIFTQPQPIAVDTAVNSNTPESPANIQSANQVNEKKYTLFNLPWHVYLLLLAYVYAIGKVLGLYLNK